MCWVSQETKSRWFADISVDRYNHLPWRIGLHGGRGREAPRRTVGKLQMVKLHLHLYTWDLWKLRVEVSVWIHTEDEKLRSRFRNCQVKRAYSLYSLLLMLHSGLQWARWSLFIMGRPSTLLGLQFKCQPYPGAPHNHTQNNPLLYIWEHCNPVSWQRKFIPSS